jgi:hypothetical protein
MPLYESDITRFLNELKRQRPDLDGEQRRARAIWWDKDPVDLEQARRQAESRVPAKAYPYQTQD